MANKLQEAAPDLLAALERLMPACSRLIDTFTLYIPEGFDTFAEDVAFAEAAIRRAKEGN